eukprot:gene2782-1767_t
MWLHAIVGFWGLWVCAFALRSFRVIYSNTFILPWILLFADYDVEIVDLTKVDKWWRWFSVAECVLVGRHVCHNGGMLGGCDWSFCFDIRLVDFGVCEGCELRGFAGNLLEYFQFASDFGFAEVRGNSWWSVSCCGAGFVRLLVVILLKCTVRGDCSCLFTEGGFGDLEGGALLALIAGLCVADNLCWLLTVTSCGFICYSGGFGCVVFARNGKCWISACVLFSSFLAGMVWLSLWLATVREGVSIVAFGRWLSRVTGSEGCVGGAISFILNLLHEDNAEGGMYPGYGEGLQDEYLGLNLGDREVFFIADVFADLGGYAVCVINYVLIDFKIRRNCYLCEVGFAAISVIVWCMWVWLADISSFWETTVGVGLVCMLMFLIVVAGCRSGFVFRCETEVRLLSTADLYCMSVFVNFTADEKRFRVGMDYFGIALNSFVLKDGYVVCYMRLLTGNYVAADVVIVLLAKVLDFENCLFVNVDYAMQVENCFVAAWELCWIFVLVGPVILDWLVVVIKGWCYLVTWRVVRVIRYCYFGAFDGRWITVYLGVQICEYFVFYVGTRMLRECCLILWARIGFVNPAMRLVWVSSCRFIVDLWFRNIHLYIHLFCVISVSIVAACGIDALRWNGEVAAVCVMFADDAFWLWFYSLLLICGVGITQRVFGYLSRKFYQALKYYLCIMPWVSNFIVELYTMFRCWLRMIGFTDGLLCGLMGNWVLLSAFRTGHVLDAGSVHYECFSFCCEWLYVSVARESIWVVYCYHVEY